MDSLRDRILAAEDRPSVDVDTPEWAKAGVPSVRVVTMGSDDRDEWEAAALLARSKESGTARMRGLRAALVSRCAVDPGTGERIFTTDEDIQKLGQKSAKVLDRLFATAAGLNAVGDDDMRKLEKNSVRGLTGGSSSALRWLQAASMWMGSLRNLLQSKSTSGAPSSGSKAIH